VSQIPPIRDWFWVLSLFLEEVTQARRFGPRSGPMDETLLRSSYERWKRKTRVAGGKTRRTATPDEGVVHTLRLGILAVVHDVPSLDRLLRSVRRQGYDAWILYLVLPVQPEASLSEGVAKAMGEDGRVVVVQSPNTPLGQVVSVDYLAVLHDGACLVDGALETIAGFIREEPAVDWLYTDEELLSQDGLIRYPVLKGGFSPELALCDDFAIRLAVVRVGLLGDVTADRAAARVGLQDVFLRLGEQRPLAVRHVPEPCVCRTEPPGDRQSVADALGVTATAALGRRALAATVMSRSDRRGINVAIRWTGTPRMPVTIIIPTRDRLDLLRSCLTSLAETVDASLSQVLIADDESQEPETRDYLSELGSRCPLPCRVRRIRRTGNRFDYATLMNTAAADVATPLMLHLNNDVAAVAPGWLQQMAGWFAVAEVGVVGAKLLRRDGTIQHAGVILGGRAGLPLHLFDGLSDEGPGYLGLAHVARNVSAVTGACLLTDTSLFRRLGGFDRDAFAVQYNDIDFCLRVQAQGRRIVYEPAAVLRHDASASRGTAYSTRENRLFRKKYGAMRDPYWSPHFAPRSLAGPTPLVTGN